MAFYNDKEDEDQQSANAQAPGAQTQSGSSVITGDSGLGGGASSPKANAPDKPGNFVNLNQYLEANKTQAAKLGDQASGVIGQSANTAQQGITNLNQEAQEKIKPVGFLSDDLSAKVKSNAESLTPEQRAQVKSTTSATYQGPQSAADLNSYQSAADANNKAVKNIDNSGTEQGRMSLISQINSKPRTQGMNVFDNALLQAGGGREKLAAAAQANQGVKGALDTATQGIQGQIGRADDPSTPNIDESTGAIGQTGKAQADAYKKVQDALSSWTKGFQPKVANAQKNLVDQQSRVTQDIADNPLQLSDETLGLFGLKPDTKIYKNDLNSYLSQASPSDVTAANVASPEDYARYGALADLAGDKSGFLNPANAGMAGKLPSLKIDTTKLQNDLKTSNDAYEKAYNSQQGGVLNFGYLPVANGVDQSFLDPRLKQASPQQLEDVWLPAYTAAMKNNPSDPQYPLLINLVQKSLADWKSQYGANNVVNGTQDLPTNADGSIDWSKINAPKGK